MLVDVRELLCHLPDGKREPGRPGATTSPPSFEKTAAGDDATDLSVALWLALSFEWVADRVAG